MFDFKARQMIEALRSGVPSRTVGEYFSEARPAMMKKIFCFLLSSFIALYPSPRRKTKRSTVSSVSALRA